MTQTTANFPGQRPAGPRDDGDSIDVIGLLSAIWRGKWVILALALLGGLIAGYYAFRVAEPTYRATTQMALNLDQATPVSDLDRVVSGVSKDAASLNTEMQIIRSRELISRLVDRLNLTEDPEFNARLRPVPAFSLEAVKDGIRGALGLPQPDAGADPSETAVRNAVISRVQSAISTSVSRQTYVFTISAVTQSPVKSALLTNTLAQIYQDDQIAIKVEGTETAAIWLSERVSELRADLESQQGAINALRSGGALISPEALEVINRQSLELANQIQSAEIELERAEARLSALQAAQGDDVAVRTRIADDAQLNGLASEAASGDRAALLRFDRRFQQLLLQAQSTREQLAERVAELTAQSERLASQFDNQAADLIEIQQLEREAEATRVLYETFLNRLRETSVQIGVQQADSRILSEAIRGQYIAPRKTTITATGMILGALIAALIVLARELMQNTYRTADDLERTTGVSVLGQIPQIPVSGRIETIDYISEKPTSAATEAVRNLRTSVLMSNVDTPPQVIMMTSSLPAEGKTTTAIALAQNLAGLNKRILLLEGDIRRRTFSAYFPDETKRPGILSVIAQFGQDAGRRAVPLQDAVFTPKNLQIDVLMGEKSAINAADVFASAAFREFLAAAREAYDYIIIDTPPVLVVPDARVIGPFADAIIYAVNWDKTTKAQVEEGLRQLSSVNLRVTGLALTKIDPRGMKRYGYGKKYGYGAYAAYSGGYYDN